MNSAACQKEASPLAGRPSQLGIGDAWNLTKPDMRSRVAGGEIGTNRNVYRAAEKVIFLTLADGVEGFSDIITRERKEFSESIKKGSISNATLWNGAPPDRDFCRMQKSILKQNQQFKAPQDNHAGNIGGITYKIFVGQPFGSMPKRSSSLRPSVLSQLAKLIPASEAATSNCAFSSGVILTWKAGALPPPFGCLSLCIIVDMCVPIGLVSIEIGTHLNTVESIKTTPWSGGTLPGRLTSNVMETNAMAKPQCNQTHPKFQYRFLAISRIDRNAKPCRMSVEASTEREARQVLAPHFILSLAARLPVQEATHA